MALSVLDAGVLIGVLDASDTLHDPARERMRELLDNGASLVVPVSVYAEILVGPFQHGDHAVGRVEDFISDLGALIEPTSVAIARAAAALRATHGSKLRLPDALVLATAQALKADRVITTDTRWPPRLPVNVEAISARTRS